MTNKRNINLTNSLVIVLYNEDDLLLDKIKTEGEKILKNEIKYLKTTLERSCNNVATSFKHKHMFFKRSLNKPYTYSLISKNSKEVKLIIDKYNEELKNRKCDIPDTYNLYRHLSINDLVSQIYILSNLALEKSNISK